MADVKVPLFGARARVKELSAEVASLKAEMDRLGVPEITQLERRHDELNAQIAAQQATLDRQLPDHRAKIHADGQAAARELETRLTGLNSQITTLETRRRELQESLVADEDSAMLQAVGIYLSRHPLTDAPVYQGELERLRDRIKTMNKKGGGAIRATTSWTVNGSVPQGRVMVNETSKLMLRAYNAEADNLVRAMKPFKLDSSIDRLSRAAKTIERLGQTMSIAISESYHQLRVTELEITADYLNKVAQDKEREREERVRLREERKVQQEIEAERRRLEKERQHYLNALAAVEAKGEAEPINRLRSMLDEIERSIEAVDYRAANVRAGYVYVISNLGSFGERIVKIGMTRRLEPLDRVRELGDASVPFRFDVHALFFSDDAVGIEQAMHERLAHRRVNHVNLRREFFHATPVEAREHLLELTGDLLHFEELPEALEYRQSRSQSDHESVALPSPGG
ncbi:MAG: DUF4041 domain-containing protein [Actinomycetota bacterium]|nr:DUF4041 domain-containing protein [Actinomycetota bacterium]